MKVQPLSGEFAEIVLAQAEFNERLADLQHIPGVSVDPPTGLGELWCLRVPRTAWGLTGLPQPAWPTLQTASVLLDRTLFPHQREAVRRATERGALVLGDQLGLGKQQPVDALVMTPSGWQTIGSLRPGDFVIGSDGKPTQVLGVYPQGKRQNYHVHFSDGSSLETGAEHLWTFRYLVGGKRWGEIVLSTNDLLHRARPVVSPSGRLLTISKTPLYLPMLSGPIDFAAQALPITPYLLGQMIANADCRQPKLATNALDWPEVEARLQAEGAPISGVRTYGSVVHASLVGLREPLRALGLDVLSKHKRIPRSYLLGSAAQRHALLQGLMDADGSCSATCNRVVFHTTSPGLALDVRELVEGLGGVASVRSYDRTAENKPVEFQVRVRLPPGYPPFSISRKADRYKPLSRENPVRTFVRVEPGRVVESVCIEVAAADSLYLTERCILTHNTTSAAAAAAAALRADPSRCVLVCGPQYLRATWRDELEAMGLLRDGPFWAARGLVPTERTTRGLHGAKWLFAHYDILRGWWNTLMFSRFAAVIFDEAHLLKNSKSQRAQAAAMVSPGTALRLVLTGTPVQNRLSESHSLLTLATGPRTWGHPLTFRIRYSSAMKTEYGWQDGAPSHVEELQARLDDVYLRRDHSVLDKPLPSRTRRKVVVDLEPELAAQIQAELDGYTPRQVLDAMRRSQTGDRTLEWIGKLRKATSLAKKRATVEHVSSLLEQGDSVVIFAWTRVMVQSLAQALHGYGVHGGMTQDERDAVIQDWKLDPRPRALVATYDTLSTGVTLTKANHVIFHDLEFVPAKMLQAEGRVYRIGQSRPVQSWWMVADRTLDEFVFQLVNRKAPATAVLGEMGTGELADFFGNAAEEREAEDLVAWCLRQEG